MIPSTLASSIAGMNVAPVVILLLILLLYAILGCIMDALSMIVLLVPIFLPIVSALGFDLIWFGVLMVMVMEMGQITPPVGINAFIIAGIAKDVPLSKVFRGLVPFIIALVVAILIVVFIPQISLLIPNAIYG
jgi:TRAP-type C4-dicarboxylate transport system permease large subunit